MGIFDLTDDQIREAASKLSPEQAKPWLDIIEQRKLRDKLLAELEEKKDYDQILMFVGSEHRAEKLVSWKDELTDDQVRELLTDYWSVTEGWSGDEDLREGMLELLHRVQPLMVMDEEDPRPLPDDEELVIYRGNLGEVPSGGSWTLDRMIAEKFARMASSMRGQFLGMRPMQEGDVPSIWRARVSRDDVLGYFDNRAEREIVIDNGMAYDIELIAQAVK